MMRRAGHYTTAEKVDQIHENMRTEYKFFVCLSDQIDLADLMEQAAEYEELKKAQKQEARAEKRAASTAATISCIRPTKQLLALQTTRIPQDELQAARQKVRTACLSKIATRYRETRQRPGRRYFLERIKYPTASPIRSARRTHVTSSTGHRFRNLPHQCRSPSCSKSPDPTHRDRRGNTLHRRHFHYDSRSSHPAHPRPWSVCPTHVPYPVDT